MDRLDYLICPFCRKEFSKRYAKSCGNCFTCLGCEIYECPFCLKEIVIKPMPKISSDEL